jgi:hypothetical protein
MGRLEQWWRRLGLQREPVRRHHDAVTRPAMFLSYTSTLSPSSFRTASGATVRTLPATTRVDFAQLVDLSELIMPQIPAGDYWPRP